VSIITMQNLNFKFHSYGEKQKRQILIESKGVFGTVLDSVRNINILVSLKK
jgi:hypothetical protein